MTLKVNYLRGVNMNIFVIHKSNDKDSVTALTNRINDKVKSANFLILSDGNNNWKKEARQENKNV